MSFAVFEASPERKSLSTAVVFFSGFFVDPIADPIARSLQQSLSLQERRFEPLLGFKSEVQGIINIIYSGFVVQETCHPEAGYPGFLAAVLKKPSGPFPGYPGFLAVP